MKRARYSIIIFVLWLSCFLDIFETSEPSDISLSTEKNPISFRIGQTWLHRRKWVNIGAMEAIGMPDTLIAYTFSKAVKDTIIDNLPYIIIEGRDYDISRYEISTYPNRYAINFSDNRISMYEFDTDTLGFSWGLLKSQKQANKGINIAKYGTRQLKEAGMAKVFDGVKRIPEAYRDFVYPLVFPLVIDSPYVWRDTGFTEHLAPYRIVYRGKEFIDVPAGQFETYKLEYLSGELIGNPEIQIFRYIGTPGLVKLYADYGSTLMTDELGRAIGTVFSSETVEYMGTDSINPDTLLPWLRMIRTEKQIEDALNFADIHFNCDRLWTFYSRLELFLQNNFAFDEKQAEELRQAITYDSTEIANFCSTRDLESHEIIASKSLAHGWDDTEPILVDTGYVLDNPAYMYSYQPYQPNGDTIWMFIQIDKSTGDTVNPKTWGYSAHQIKYADMYGIKMIY